MAAEAFEWLMLHMTEALETPDEHVDWIHMVDSRDWGRLQVVWCDQSEVWRESFAYVLSMGPAGQSFVMLKNMLDDPSSAVREQVAESLLELSVADEDTPVVIDHDLMQRIEAQVDSDTRNEILKG